jgi:hypothetical protein
MNKIGPFIVRVFNSSKAVVIFALAIPSALGVLLALSDWLNATSPYAVWIRANFILMCLAFAAIILAWTIYLVYDMRIRYIEGYKIKISGDLNATWESKGSLPLRISSDNELIITDCSEGCITKTGAFWENYDLLFKANITTLCLGIIVRATDIDNYEMIQITPTTIVPHRKILVPTDDIQFVKDASGKVSHVNIPPYMVGWQVGPQLAIKYDTKNGWFDVKVSVQGSSASLSINGVEFLSTIPLHNPYGRIGFRNHGIERALVKDIRIVVPSYR